MKVTVDVTPPRPYLDSRAAPGVEGGGELRDLPTEQGTAGGAPTSRFDVGAEQAMNPRGRAQ